MEKLYFNTNIITYKSLIKKYIHAPWALRNEGIKIIRKPQDGRKMILSIFTEQTKNSHIRVEMKEIII